jgi:O-antigen/teichoic acid export membrane protein
MWIANACCCISEDRLRAAGPGCGASVLSAMLKTKFAQNVVGMALPLAVALVTVPLYVGQIGAARYGVLSIIWVLLGYFGFLDFGLARAATNALAKLADGQAAQRASVLMTSLYANLAIGALGAAVLYLAGGFLLHRLLHLPDELDGEVQSALPVIAAMLPLALVGGVGRGALEARERFLAVNLLDLIGISLGQILPLLCAVLIGPALPILVPAAFAARAISVGLIFCVVARTEGMTGLRAFDRQRLSELLGFGAWVTVINVIGPLLGSIDHLLVGSALGAAAVTYYAVPMSLVTRSQIVAVALSRTLFPRFSRLASAEATGLAEQAIVALAYAFGAVCAPAIILGGPFLRLWMGPPFAAEAAPVIELLMIGAWINGLAFIPYALLQGQGRPGAVAKLNALELAPFIAVLWIMLDRYGLVGAAFAWTLRMSIDTFLLCALARFRVAHLLRLLPALALLLAAYLFVRSGDLSTAWSAALAGSFCLAYVAAAVAFDATTRRMVLALRSRIVAAFA